MTDKEPEPRLSAVTLLARVRHLAAVVTVSQHDQIRMGPDELDKLIRRESAKQFCEIMLRYPGLMQRENHAYPALHDRSGKSGYVETNFHLCVHIMAEKDYQDLAASVDRLEGAARQGIQVPVEHDPKNTHLGTDVAPKATGGSEHAQLIEAVATVLIGMIGDIDDVVPTTHAEVNRLKALAQTSIKAAMWAVKAAMKPGAEGGSAVQKRVVEDGGSE